MREAMARTKKSLKDDVFQWAGQALKLGLQPMLELFTRTVEERIEKWERRILALKTAFFCLRAGFLFLVLGLFFLLVDYGGLPRGLVFSAGGFLILLVSWVYLRVGNKK